MGQRRDSNEDAFSIVGPKEAPTGALAFIAVADGMGGHKAGEVASTMAIQRLLARLTETRAQDLAQGVGDSVALTREVGHVNTDVFEAGVDPNLNGMGTTLTVGLLVERFLHLAHVGDSRAYLIRKRQLSRLTRDHSWVEEQVDAGVLSRNDAEGHPGRNLLTRAIGIGRTVEVDNATVAVQSGDKILLCSDGLHSLLADGEITKVISQREPQIACETLVKRANAKGGTDNITAVVMRINQLQQNSGDSNHKPSDQDANEPGTLGKALNRISRAVAKRGEQRTQDLR